MTHLKNLTTQFCNIPYSRKLRKPEINDKVYPFLLTEYKITLYFRTNNPLTEN